MESAAEMWNLHWYLLKYEHLCYNLLILLKGFAWYRKIYNVMDYYFIIWAKGKKLQIFAGFFFYCISNFFFQFWKHNAGDTVEGCSHTKYGNNISLVGFGFPSMCNFILYLRHFFVAPVIIIIQKQRNMLMEIM